MTDGLRKYKKILLGIAAVLDMLLILFCIAGVCGKKEVYDWTEQEMSVYEGSMDDSGRYYIDETDGAGEGVCLAMNLPDLKSGVYEVFLEFQSENFNGSNVTVEGSDYRRLYSNGATLLSSDWEKDVSYRFRLKGKPSDAQVFIRYSGAGALEITGFRVVHTHQEYGMFLFFVLLFSLIAVCVLCVFAGKEKIRPDREKRRILFGLSVIFFLSCTNLMIDYMHVGDDVYFHLNRIEGIAREWMAGHFPARMHSYCLYGLGYPSSIMYPDVLLWPIALLRVIGFDLTFCYKAVIVLQNLLTVLLSYFSFRGIFRDKKAALWGCAVYTLSLYRLYNIYGRAAVGEFTAMTFLPLICCGLTRVFSPDEETVRDKKTVLILAFGYTGVLYSHVLSMELAAAFTVILCILFWKRFFRKSTFLTFVKAALLSVALSLWFLVPFLDYSLHADMQVFGRWNPIQILGLYPLQLFWVFPWSGYNPHVYATGMQDIRAYGIGMGLLAVFLYYLYLRITSAVTVRTGSAGAAFGNAAVYADLEKEDTDYRKTGTAAVIGFLAMLMSLSLFPWDRISGLSQAVRMAVSSIQFPYRFLVIATIALTYLGCGMFVMLKRKGDGKKGNLFAAAVLAMTLFSGIFYLNDEIQYLYWSGLRDVAGMGFGMIEAGEYLPKGADELRYTVVETGSGVRIEDYDKINSHVEFACENSTDQESYVDCNLLCYPGYHAWNQESGKKLPVTKGKNSVLRIQIPAGYEGVVEVDFTGESYWKAADVLSAVLWAAVFGYFVYGMIRNKRKSVNSELQEREENGADGK